MKIILIGLLCTLTTWHAFSQPDHIILFRHAEKMQGKDPHLTAKGQERAKRLATMVQSYAPKHLFSTNYNRTQQTILPLAKKVALPVTHYEPHDLSTFADNIRKLTGTVAIAGHSNTTPALIKLLSGHIVTINENQFSKVFILTPNQSQWKMQKLSSN
ncbi:histidine phosphatase family protein [Pseudoalteromonas sp. MMG013]|uniref:SixA phosphatase family protein n=1 Tax=unclassified Pseudoalteromonas TaxID=194690 RepID=UPI001B36E54E|nr:MULTISPECIES: histidine phosphatase family protein [unclassified Pseudoalteromonas]MBQ4850439.1 histidine phosphatase family protein [Pseudoalteromonas sp. MMG012]MBQ4863659.1 histidine phosphatase family protein [Pseudoalteromonas sp. MMG013]